MEAHGTEQVILSLETLFFSLTFSDENLPGQLKVALKCAVTLCDAKREHCERFVDFLESRLTRVDGNC